MKEAVLVTMIIVIIKLFVLIYTTYLSISIYNSFLSPLTGVVYSSSLGKREYILFDGANLLKADSGGLEGDP